MTETITVPLEDGSSIVLGVGEASLNPEHKWPGNALKTFTHYYDTPSGQAGVPINATYVPGESPPGPLDPPVIH